MYGVRIVRKKRQVWRESVKLGMRRASILMISSGKKKSKDKVKEVVQVQGLAS